MITPEPNVQWSQTMCEQTKKKERKKGEKRDPINHQRTDAESRPNDIKEEKEIIESVYRL
jgi:hypothetical protein